MSYVDSDVSTFERQFDLLRMPPKKKGSKPVILSDANESDAAESASLNMAWGRELYPRFFINGALYGQPSLE